MATRKHEREMERRVATGKPMFAEDVRANVSRLGGRTISDLIPDKGRGAGSPLGHGMGSKKMKGKR